MSICRKTLISAGNSKILAILRQRCDQWRRTLADTLLPQECLLCGALAGSQALCAACHADLPALPHPGCPQCARPTPQGEHCGACLKRPPAFDASHVAWRYAFPVDRLIQGLKYNGRLALAEVFADALAAALPVDFSADLLLPVPLHPHKLGQRGFNQAHEIAQLLAARCDLPLASDVVVRQRATVSQTTLPWPKRAANIRNAFLCRRDLQGLRVAILDDVLTSGATAHELAKTLKLHGAAHVSVLAVARAIQD